MFRLKSYKFWHRVLFNIGLFVLLAELVLRISGLCKNYGEVNNGVFLDYTQSPYSGPLSTWSPNIIYEQRCQEFVYEVKTNSLGIRDEEHEISKGHNIVRIAVLGDSFTEGVGAPFDSAWHQRMSWYFAQDRSMPQVEVISGAASGSDPFYGYEMLRRQLVNYHPDIIIQVYNHTDVSDYMARGGMERFVNDSTTVWRPVNKMLHQAFKYSHLVRFVVKVLLRYSDNYLSLSEQKKIKSVVLRDIEELFLKMDSLGNSIGAQVVFIIQPLNYECQEKQYESFAQVLLLKMDSLGLKHIDLLSELPDDMKANCKDYYWPIDGHMNSKGYNAWGNIIYRQLKPLLNAD